MDNSDQIELKLDFALEGIETIAAATVAISEMLTLLVKAHVDAQGDAPAMAGRCSGDDQPPVSPWARCPQCGRETKTLYSGKCGICAGLTGRS